MELLGFLAQCGQGDRRVVGGSSGIGYFSGVIMKLLVLSRLLKISLLSVSKVKNSLTSGGFKWVVLLCC
jgi:hypothetical protein